jgi:hypothetical protein
VEIEGVSGHGGGDGFVRGERATAALRERTAAAAVGPLQAVCIAGVTRILLVHLLILQLRGTTTLRRSAARPRCTAAENPRGALGRKRCD